MGGVLFLLGPLAALIAAPSSVTLALLVLVVVCAAIGFVDDIMAIRLGRNRGMRARTKLLLTGVAAAGFIWIVLASQPGLQPAIFGLGQSRRRSLWCSVSCAIVGTTHAVNLTDGLDGLAGGTIVPPLAVVAYAAFAGGRNDVGIFELAMIGTSLRSWSTICIRPRFLWATPGRSRSEAALAGGAS